MRVEIICIAKSHHMIWACANLRPIVMGLNIVTPFSELCLDPRGWKREVVFGIASIETLDRTTATHSSLGICSGDDEGHIEPPVCHLNESIISGVRDRGKPNQIIGVQKLGEKSRGRENEQEETNRYLPLLFLENGRWPKSHIPLKA